MGRPLKLALGAGALAGVAVLAAGLLAVAAQPVRWSAQSSLLVLPRAPTADPDLLAGLYDSLSRGQVTATYAELLRTRPVELDSQAPSAAPTAPPPPPEVRDPAARDTLNRMLGLRADADGTEQPAEGVAETDTDFDVQVDVVPETSVIRITATADSPAGAEGVADAVAEEGQRHVATLSTPYAIEPLAQAAGSAERAGPGLPLLTAVVLVLALVSGIAVGQAVHYVLTAHRSVQAPAGAAPAAGETAAEPLFAADGAPPRQDGSRGSQRVGRGVPR